MEVARVAKASFVDDTQSLGTLRARRSVVVRPEASGRIQALKFTDGQRVRKGALLVQLDDTLQRAQLQQAEASASIARTNLQRSRELAAQNFVSQSAVDQNAAALEVALAQVALAQAQVGRMRIVAPFDGITGIRSVNVGDYVKDGAELVVLEDLGALWVDFRLPERYLSRLREGQSVQLSLDAMPGKTYQAKVVALDAQLDTNGRALLVRASLANEDGRLRGGMFARVRTVFSVRDQALVIPEEALVPVGDDQVVFKVIDGERGKVARRTSVRIGARLPGKVEIVEGLAEGDVVVVAGQARLVRGDNLPVRVVDLNRPAAGGPPGAGGAARPPGASAATAAPTASGAPGAPGARPAAAEGGRGAGAGRPS